MKRWIPARHDRRHAALAPASRRCRARRLAMERCEDRRMLSGSSLTTEFVNVSLVGEGGFLAVNTSGFLLTDANNFLFDADSFGQPTTRFGLSTQWQPTGVGQQIIVPNYSSTFDNEAASSIAPTIGPALYDFDLSGKQVLDVRVLTSGEDDLSSDNEKILVDNPPYARANDSPGLQGKTTKFLVNEDSIQIVASLRNSDRRDQREGGTLEVAAVVLTTQRAYETQLSAVIVSNLNRDGMLPTTAPTLRQPVVAELARAVAFETIGLRTEVQAVEATQMTEGPLVEPTPSTLEPVATLQHVPSLRHPSATETMTGETTANTSTISGRSEDSATYLAERVENEQQAAQAIHFAQWPTLATLITGYLLIEHRSPQAAETVQMPPRRQRPGFRKTAKSKPIK